MMNLNDRASSCRIHGREREKKKQNSNRLTFAVYQRVPTNETQTEISYFILQRGMHKGPTGKQQIVEKWCIKKRRLRQLMRRA